MNVFFYGAKVLWPGTAGTVVQILVFVMKQLEAQVVLKVPMWVDSGDKLYLLDKHNKQTFLNYVYSTILYFPKNTNSCVLCLNIDSVTFTSGTVSRKMSIHYLRGRIWAVVTFCPSMHQTLNYCWCVLLKMQQHTFVGLSLNYKSSQLALAVFIDDSVTWVSNLTWS